MPSFAYEYSPLIGRGQPWSRLIQPLPVAESNIDAHAPTRPPGPLADDGAVPGEEPCQCYAITDTPLERPPSYIALSYAWGNPAHVHSISLGGTLFRVGRNLGAALRHLNLDHGPSSNLWVDAICINQNDTEEKEEQVRHMRHIYSRAAGVICWLGPAANESDTAMRWIDYFGRLSFELGIGTKPELRLRPLLRLLDSGQENVTGETLRAFLRDLKSQLSGESPEGRKAIAALGKLFRRPYWRRIWVVQEVVLGKDVRFMCGRVTVTDEHLNHALRLIRNFAPYLRMDVAKKEALKVSEKEEASEQVELTACSVDISRPISLIKVRRDKGPFQLAYLLRLLYNFEATDPRDRIFALLGLASDTEALGLQPHYGQSYQDAFVDAAVALFRNGYLDLLSLCHGQYSSSGDIPSWAPDFSKKRVRSGLQARSLLRRAKPITTALQPTFSASGNSPHACEFSGLGGDMASRSMSLPGMLIGRVRDVGSPWEAQGYGRWLRDLEDLSAPIFGPERRTEHLKAVWRTAVADHEVRRVHDIPRQSSVLVQKLVDSFGSAGLGEVDKAALEVLGAGSYTVQLERVAKGRRPFAAGEYVGIGPGDMEPGDQVYILAGLTVPYVLRLDDADKKLRVVGEVFVFGIMDGEAMEGSPQLSPVTIY